MDDLKGKRALITGSSTGIGAAVAREVRAAGGQGGGARQQECRGGRGGGRGDRRGGRQGGRGDRDVSAPAARVVDDAVAGLGGLDILVNNAGAILERVTNAGFDEAIYEAVYDLNVRSVLAVTKAAYPHLKAAGGGSIDQYRLGGRAIRRFRRLDASMPRPRRRCTRSRATRHASSPPDNIRVNVVAPGFIITPFHDTTPQSVMEAAAAQIPMKRLGTAEDCVGAYVFLASEAMSGYITGQIIDVNGGQLMRARAAE